MIINNGVTALIAAWGSLFLGIIAGDMALGWLAGTSILFTYAFEGSL